MSGNWENEWAAISQDLSAFQEVAQVYLNLYAQWPKKDQYSQKDSIIAQAKRLYDRVRTFSQVNEGFLPATTKQWLDRFVKELDSKEVFTHPATTPLVEDVYFPLTIVKAEVDKFLPREQMAIRSISERAFLHLARLLAVSEPVRMIWKQAFACGEPALERLGAIHLLSHGIWAFKADTIRARTDLILADKGIDLHEVERTGTSLVLTEWKRAEPERTMGEARTQALAQTKIYRWGPLAGYELSKRAFLVLVSMRSSQHAQAEFEEEGVVYRCIHLEIEPDAPSVAARKER